MTRISRGTAAVAALVLGLAVLAGCGSSDSSSDKGSSDDVQLTQGKNLTIGMVTHGEGDTFWAVVKKGAEQAAKDTGV
jgi:ABC-type sugar transport system substrate-binding protein